MKFNSVKFGIYIPIIFFTTTIICGLILPEYNHFTNMVSELGGLNTSTQYLFSTGLVLSSIISIIWAFSLLDLSKKHQINRIPIFFIFAFSISIAGAGIFPYPTIEHSYFSLPAISLILSPILAIILWRNDKRFKNLKVYGIISLIFFLFGFSVFSNEILAEFFGLKQRLFHIAWAVWFIGLTSNFQKLNLNPAASRV